MRKILGLYYEWVTATVGPIIDKIPYDLGQSWVFWIVVWFFLIDPPILVAIFANKALATRYSGIFNEVGSFRAGSISAKQIFRLSRVSKGHLAIASGDDRLSAIHRWLWFAYVWQVLFWISFVLVISVLIARSQL